MSRTKTITCLSLMALFVLSGCSSYVSAPVSSRNTEPEPRARVAGQPDTRTRQPVAPAGASYVVRRGDTLYSIAWQHGLEVRTLAALNGIRAPYTIYAGQRLQLGGESVVRGAPLADRSRIEARPLPDQAAAPPAPEPVAGAASAPNKPRAAAPQPAHKPGPAHADVNKQAVYDGNWVWPTRGRVIRGFQQNTTGKKGIDIGGHSGQPVKAAATGKVVYVGSGLVGYGRLIIVKHNESLLSAYGHNSKLLVKEGDHVTAGQMIAKMGNSGTDRTALYFEIRKDGKPVNPLQYLPRI